ncbi:MAG: DinB family protein [Anaerolineales bacterium]|nr:DinB family protein [Anaerolineales bacterium]
MNANAFRQFYDYHFSENRKLWESVTALSYEQFTQAIAYSRGSVRDQILHLIDADEVWFCELQVISPSDPFPEATVDDRPQIRAHWDAVEQQMRAYLAGLRDEMLFEKPIQEPEEDKELFVWQVLLHVANHGTDHRAQLLRNLHDLGIKTTSQDYIFYIFEHLM